MDVSADESIAAIVLTGPEKMISLSWGVILRRFGLPKIIFTINLNMHGL